MSVLRVIRFSLWGAALVFTCIVLAISAHSIVLVQSQVNGEYDYYNPYYTGTSIDTTYARLALAVAALTLSTLPVFIAIDETRRGAITSMILVEMVTLTILWILWLSAGAISAETVALAGCSSATGVGTNVICSEHNAITAFCFLNFFALMGYAFILLVFTMIAHNRGNHDIWMQSVQHANFFAPPATSTSGAPEMGVPEKAWGMPHVLAPQAQYPYPPTIVTPPPMNSPLPYMVTTPPPQGMPYGMTGPPMQPMSPLYTGSPIPQQYPGYFVHPGTPQA